MPDFPQRSKKVVAAIREMDDATLWRFLRSLAFRASQGQDMGEVPIDLASYFVVEHFEKHKKAP